MQLGAVRLRRPHHRDGELCGMDLSGGFGRAQTLIDPDTGGEPNDAVNIAMLPGVHGPAIGSEPAIVPVAADLLGQ
ncbi:MAG TPA: hypothetical protein VJX94_11690, partial [Stellaceae bacterium]|nr:hypothetical protein [Stellaceae bacterium]